MSIKDYLARQKLGMLQGGNACPWSKDPPLFQRNRKTFSKTNNSSFHRITMPKAASSVLLQAMTKARKKLFALRPSSLAVRVRKVLIVPSWKKHVAILPKAVIQTMSISRLGCQIPQDGTWVRIKNFALSLAIKTRLSIRRHLTLLKGGVLCLSETCSNTTTCLSTTLPQRTSLSKC